MPAVKDILFIKTNVDGEKYPSSSKFWFNIANIAITVVYVWIGIGVARAATPPIGEFAWLTLVYSGVVTANKFANSFLNYKYGSSTSKSEEPRIEVSN